ncbi:MAG: FAD-dependent oxidoreductase [Opitutales bacterium]|nr:FAD-dependent oxidoreductase [Opitutales bacterium]MBT6770051.1 FAD-dependent oxidoreductase [Opitutales bacterium]
MTLPRRNFISQLSLASVSLLATHPLFGKTAKSNDRSSVLVETAHFKKLGGWMLDNQFENHLGFSYLLAHGLGNPVENASANIVFPKTGRYHAWVLTKDWCPGEWESPGQFKVLLGDKPLPETLGTETDWTWQSGGTVDVGKDQLSNSISLQDLTGFEGRCSAIYFSLDSNDTPPIDSKTLPRWRREKVGLPSSAVDQGHFDLIIVGGGIAGCAAAIAADSQGTKVAVIHNRPVLGGNASSEIRVHTEGIHGQAGDILEKIDTPHYPNSDPLALDADINRMGNMASLRNVDYFLSHTMVSVEMQEGRIHAVNAIETANGTLKRFTADQFIDSSGDGWVGYMAGAEFRYGRESKHEFNEGWDEHGELWSPEKPDNRVMGSSVMWYTRKTDRRVDFPTVPWAKPVANNHVATEGEWQWEYSHNDLHQIHDAETIRDHMFRAIYGSYSNAIKHRQNANMELDWISFLVGKRESRRIIGAHIFTGIDARDSIEFPDTVVTEKRKIDVHYQEKLLGRPVDFLSEAIFQKIKNTYYYIPYRSLYSRDVPNLQMAGRCFSCTHIGLGGPRVMNTCGQMGVATGFGAALCIKHKADPANIGEKYITELRTLCGYST